MKFSLHLLQHPRARAILSRAPKRSHFEDEARPFPEQVIVRNALSRGVCCGDFLAGM
jgi:hypothetical protein